MTDVLEDIVLDVDLTLEPACASLVHGDGAWDWCHDDAPATCWLTLTCGHSGLRCEKFRAVAVARGGATCPVCNSPWFPGEFRFTDL